MLEDLEDEEVESAAALSPQGFIHSPWTSLTHQG